ncbi:MAG: hypothetical protein ACE361_26440 [Aureliella sp.]
MRETIRVLMPLTIALYLGCEQSNDNGALTVTKTGEQWVNDIGIASFPTPLGWMPNRSDGNTVIILTRQGADPETLEEMISIDVGKPVSSEVEGSADGLADKFGGTVSKLPYTVDGSEAYRVSIPPTFDSLMPRECIVIHHNQRVCFLFGGSKAQADLWPTVEAIAKSWQWN